jgi:cyclopropane fatty-acyl-phospholipid synthase-like methyltransferase
MTTFSVLRIRFSVICRTTLIRPTGSLLAAAAIWQTRTSSPSNYFQRIQEYSNYAARFTRKLYEIHRPLAEQVAGMLDLRGVKSLLDLGGGSGDVSFVLLRKQHDLASVVVDVENVCRVGREIATENGLEKRITYAGEIDEPGF